jgi:hypothetical protein
MDCRVSGLSPFKIDPRRGGAREMVVKLRLGFKIPSNKKRTLAFFPSKSEIRAALWLHR